jgi:hypothetical protein
LSGLDRQSYTTDQPGKSRDLAQISFYRFAPSYSEENYQTKEKYHKTEFYQVHCVGASFRKSTKARV